MGGEGKKPLINPVAGEVELNNQSQLKLAIASAFVVNQ
jgi:hypothetical protein